MPTRRTEPAVAETVEETKQEAVQQETKYRMDKLRAKCMQLFHITTTTIDGAMYGCEKTEMTVKEAQSRINKWLGKE